MRQKSKRTARANEQAHTTEKEGFVIKLVKNVVKRPYRFRILFRDGHEDVVTVEAETYQAAKLLLPKDKKLYWYLKTDKPETK